jgi:hypothetical protein
MSDHATLLLKRSGSAIGRLVIVGIPFRNAPLTRETSPTFGGLLFERIS